MVAWLRDRLWQVMEYEYDSAMEVSYQVSFLKSFKRQIDDCYFSFIIVDAVFDKVAQMEEFWSYAMSKGFQASITTYRLIIYCRCHNCLQVLVALCWADIWTYYCLVARTVGGHGIKIWSLNGVAVLLACAVSCYCQYGKCGICPDIWFSTSSSPIECQNVISPYQEVCLTRKMHSSNMGLLTQYFTLWGISL